MRETVRGVGSNFGGLSLRPEGRRREIDLSKSEYTRMEIGIGRSIQAPC